MRDYRARLRKQGLRPIQIWVPDQDQPEFSRTLKKQIQALDSAEESKALEFIAETVDWSE